MTATSARLDNPLTQLTLPQLRSRTSSKWQRYDPDVLPLWVAEMDVELADPVRAELLRAVSEGDTGYAAPAAYRQSLVDFAARHWGWEIAVDGVAAVANVITGYVDAIDLVTGGPGAVVVTSPVYPPFYSYVTVAGHEIIEAPLSADLRLDLDALDGAFTRAVEGGRPAALLLCNPHNPGGTVHTRDELEAVAALARRHGVRVVSDEIHAPIVYSDATYVPFTTVAGGENGIALHAASKAFNLAGMPAALMIGGAQSAAEVAEYAASTHHGPTQFGVLAQTAAYNDGDAWLESLLDGLDANRTLLTTLLDEHLPEASLYHPGATYLTWIDCRPLDLGDDPSEHFLEHARVGLNPGPSFGTGGAGHVRLNIATHPDIITEAVRRMGASTHRG